MAHAYNPSYSGGNDQEIRVQSHPPKVVLETLISKIPNTKQGWQSGSNGRTPA
jgi:hypothetical protein